MFYLIVIIILSAVLRFSFINHRSVWHDEGFTMMMIQFNPLEIVERTMRDVHPPFYYLVTHYFSQIFGNSELAIRGLSALFGVGVVIFTFLIIKSLFNQEVAKMAALFTALGPFLIRYSQEARMWNLVAFLVSAATYFLIRALQKNDTKKLVNKIKWWLLYSISMTLAAYTQYFSLLVLMPHWLYVLLTQIQKPISLIAFCKKIKGFLLSNIFVIIVFSFWVPILLEQISRVSSGYWIQREWMTIRTVPNTFYQFLSYATFDVMPDYLHELILVFLASVAIYVLRTYKEKRREIIFIISYFFIPAYFVFFYSVIRTPVYQDRYFVWSSIAFYSFLAIFTYSFKNIILKKIFNSIFVIILILGIFRVYTTESHGMRDVGEVVGKNYQTGDEIIAGELYAYFDFSYYNKTGQEAKIFINPIEIKQGYGEASLIYQKAESIAVSNLNNLRPKTNRIWFVGRDFWRDYYQKIPENWQKLQHFQKDDSSVILYSL